MDIEVVVPSYNSGETIGSCLQALLGQSFGGDYRITVVDSSDDGTDALIRARFPEVRLVHLEVKTLPGVARNMGADLAEAELVAYTDTDCVAAPDWLTRLVAAHATGDWAAVGGAILNGTPGSATGTFMYLSEFNEYVAAAPLAEKRFIPTANICYRRSVFERHRFAEDCFPGEDVLMNHGIHDAGGRLLFDPDIRVTHLNRSGFRQILRHHLRLGYTTAVTRERMPGLPGGLLVRHPTLAAAAPIAKYAFLLGRLGGYGDVRGLATALATGPLYAAASVAWLGGFWQRILSPTHRA